MKIKDLITFLILEVSSVVVAAVSFSMISTKVIAGAVAGSYFFLFSVFMLYRILHWPKFWTAWTLYPLCVFLFGVVIPMLWVRFTHFHQAFSEVQILGMSGPEFHHVSTSTIGLLMIVTLVETVVEIMIRKKN